MTMKLFLMTLFLLQLFLKTLFLKTMFLIQLFLMTLFQLMLGLPLEMVHRWWRIMLIYLTGVLAGSLTVAVAGNKNFKIFVKIH